MILTSIVIAVAAGAALSLVLTPASRLVARRVGMMDAPTGRKNHATPTPLLGGSAIVLAVVLPAVAALVFAMAAADSPPSWLPAELAIHLPGVVARAPMAVVILIGAVALHLLGLIDDRRGLRAPVKLLGQLAVAVAVVTFGNVRVLTLAGPAVSIAVTTLWLLVVINAFNFLDNMDGLAAGVAAICAAALLAAAMQMGQLFVPIWLAVMLGALVGFLPFNFPPASTFMGDAGSMVVGYLLAIFCCLTTYVQPGETVAIGSVLVPLVLMAVPIYDTLSVMALRVQLGASVFEADRRHFSHRLVQRGMTPRAAVLTIYLCTAGTAIAASLLPRLGSMGAILVGAQTVLILLIIAMLEWGGRAKGDPAETSPPT